MKTLADTPMVQEKEMYLMKLATKCSELSLRISLNDYKRQTDILRRKTDHLLYKLDVISKLHHDIHLLGLTSARKLSAQHLLGEQLVWSSLN